MCNLINKNQVGLQLELDHEAQEVQETPRRKIARPPFNLRKNHRSSFTLLFLTLSLYLYRLAATLFLSLPAARPATSASAPGENSEPPLAQLAICRSALFPRSIPPSIASHFLAAFRRRLRRRRPGLSSAPVGFRRRSGAFGCRDCCSCPGNLA